MPKIKKRIKKDFTTVSNDFLRDNELDIKERGLLVTMLSLPEGWDFSIKGLSSILPNGYESIMNSLKKLEKQGYLIRSRIREGNRIVDWLYEFSDSKIVELDNPIVEETVESGFHILENQVIEKQKQLNTKESNTKEFNGIINNNTSNVKDSKDLSIAAAEKHDSSVDERKTGKGFDTQRIVDANSVEICRLDEATRNNELSRKIISYLSDSCNCFGLDQIVVINQLPDSDFKDLFSIACDIVIDNPAMKKINNPKAYLSSQIKKCIVAYQSEERKL